MKLCIHCGILNADANKFCQQCGRPLEAALPSAGPGHSGDSTVLWAGPALPRRGLRRVAAVETLFASKNRIVVGRAPDCDVCLPHASVSRRHAQLERLPQGLVLTD